MKNFFEPKLDLPVGAVLPDVYDDSKGLIPADSFVVSRNREGSAASTYGELSWNLSAYHPECRATWLYFNYWKTGSLTPVRDQLSREIRWLMFVLMWKRDAEPLSIGTLANYLSVICAMAQFAEDASCRVQNILIDKKLLLAFVDTRCSGWMTETLGSLLPQLVRIGTAQLGFEIIDNRLLKELHLRGRQYRTTLKQHAPLPTRIYSAILSRLSMELADWEKIAGEFLPLLTACSEDPRFGRRKRSQMGISKSLNCARELRPEFTDVATACVQGYLRAKNQLLSVRGMSVTVFEVQMAAKLTIQAFSGMRDDEATSLPYHCLETTVSNGKTHYLILGRTTKLNNGRIKRTRWVTNKEGYRAIQIARQIADTIYAIFGVEANATTSQMTDHPLFVSPGYLGLAGKSLKSENGRFLAGSLTLINLDRLRARLQPTIEDTDIKELEQIDPHRAWRSEQKFQIGQPWLFMSHQLRRSLALYAQRSGLVSLPSLRRQLQHITEEMSRYYAKGSAFAKDFMADDKDHFGLEWQDSQAVSATLGYILNVLLSNDVLFGGHGNWVEHRLRGSDGVVQVDREATMRRFKKGEIAYRETCIGGCTNVGECDQVALTWLNIDCISSGCSNLVGNLPKLERVIIAQGKLVNSLHPESLEYRSENADLNILVAARDQVLLRQSGVFK